jgi:hypothetical protein
VTQSYGSRARTADVMALIATVGVGLWWTRANLRVQQDWRLNPFVAAYDNPVHIWWNYATNYLPLFLLPMFVPILMCLRANEWASSSLFRYPGTGACIGAVMALVFSLGHMGSQLMRGAMRVGLAGLPGLLAHPQVGRRNTVPIIYPAEVALAISTVWAVQKLAGRSEDSGGPVDRLATLIGVGWISWTLVAETQVWYLFGR